jgi:hypothetical protein
MQVLYHLIVLFLTANFFWYLFREKNFWAQVSAGLVLIMLILRLFLVK